MFFNCQVTFKLVALQQLHVTDIAAQVCLYNIFLSIQPTEASFSFLIFTFARSFIQLVCFYPLSIPFPVSLKYFPVAPFSPLLFSYFCRAVFVAVLISFAVKWKERNLINSVIILLNITACLSNDKRKKLSNRSQEFCPVNWGMNETRTTSLKCKQCANRCSG